MAAPISGRCKPGFEPVRDAFAENLETLDLGAGVSVWIDGREVVNLWGGYCQEARRTPWRENTLVMVASATKGLATACLLQLVEQGRVALDAPVATYWPEFAQAGKAAVTVRQILSHQAGLAGIETPFTWDDYFAWSPVVRLLERQRPLWPPGTRHGYHPNLFGFLVGELVRRVDGRTIGRYLRDEICGPFGLDFYLGLPESEEPRVAEISFISPDLLPPGPGFHDLQAAWSTPGTVAHYAFQNPAPIEGISNARALRAAEMPGSSGVGNAAALARFYGALAVGGRLDGVTVLRPETIAQAAGEQVFGPDATLGAVSRFGLGFMLRHDGFPIGPNPRAFGHPGAGGNLGFADPQRRLGFGYVMNRGKLTMFGSPTAYRLVDAVYSCLA